MARTIPCILFLLFLSTHPSHITFADWPPIGVTGRTGAVVTREALTSLVVLLFPCMVLAAGVKDVRSLRVNVAEIYRIA